MSGAELVVVVPTRNRADLAQEAVQSVLSQNERNVEIIVSDNSTEAESRSRLSAYCARAGNRRLRYIAPREPLPMARHWDWAMEKALNLSKANHVAFLTDRMLFKQQAMARLLEIVHAYPDKVVTYMHDMVDDFTDPIVVRQYTWTGNLYEVSSTRLLEMIAESVMYDSSFPRMLNCIVPRAVLRAMADRFGNIFDSIAPDWNFAFRCLATVDSILFYDKAMLVHHAQGKSTGQSAHYGITNEAYGRFVRDLGSLPVNFAAPFPEIITVWNAIISEYCNAKQVTESPKFPDINLERYMDVLAWGIDQIVEPQRREEMRTRLTARGWKQRPVTPAPSPSAEQTDGNGHSENVDKVEEFSVNGIEFQNTEEALRYALWSPRARAAASTHEALIRGRPLSLSLPREPDSGMGHQAGSGR